MQIKLSHQIKYLVIAIVIGVSFATAFIGNVERIFISPVYSDEISDIEEEIQENEELKKAKEDVLSGIQEEIEKIANSNASISSKIAALDGQIGEIQKDIDERESAIALQQVELDKQTEEFLKKEKTYKKMVGEIYKSSKLGVLDVFLTKDNGADLFRVYTIHQKVSEKQNLLLGELADDMLKLQDAKQALEAELALIEVKKQGLDEALAALRNEQALIQQQWAAQAGIQNAVKNDIANINKQLKTLTSELTAAINAKVGSGGGDNTGGGNYGGGTSPQPVTGNAGTYEVRVNGTVVDANANGPIRVVSTSGNNVFRVNGTLQYRGVLEMRADSNMYLINELPFENYLWGLGEVPSSWPAEALKTQAVAGRSYAAKNWNKRISYKYNLRDDVYDQNYVGYSKESASYGTNWVAAVNATSSKILKYGSDIASTYYHSTCGGHTLASEEVWVSALPYTRAEQDRTSQRDSFGDLIGYDSASSLDYKKWGNAGDTINDAQMMDLANATIYLAANPNRQNDILPANMSAAQLETSLGANSIQNKVGSLVNVQSVYNNGTTTLEADSRKTSYVRITGSSGTYNLPASEFWTVFNVRAPGGLHIYYSNLWTSHKENGSWNFYTRGYGHRVGMCQYGAQGRASAGQNYQQILTHYYRGTSIGNYTPASVFRVGITRVATGDITVSSDVGGGYLIYANGSLVTSALDNQTVRIIKK